MTPESSSTKTAQSLKTYQGSVCRRGHSGERYVANRSCVECSQEFAGVRKKMSNREPTPPTDSMRAAWRAARGMPAASRPEPPLCEACGNPPSKKGMHLDHCHNSHVFRGWLCSRCNLGIGLLGDTLSGVIKAAAYLNRFDNTPKHSEVS